MRQAQRNTAVLDQAYKKGGFWSLMATQFQGAFNDNLYQWVITFYLLAQFSTTSRDAETYLYLGRFPASTFVPHLPPFCFPCLL